MSVSLCKHSRKSPIPHTTFATKQNMHAKRKRASKSASNAQPIGNKNADKETSESSPRKKAAVLSVGSKTSPPFKVCGGTCECPLQCPANERLVDICLEIGDLLKAQGANRFAVRQFHARMPCRLRHLTKSLGRSTVRDLSRERGCGPISLSVFCDFVELDEVDKVSYLEHLKKGAAHDSFVPEFPDWLYGDGKGEEDEE